MADKVVVVGQDVAALMGVAVALRGIPVTIVHAESNSLAHAAQAMRHEPAAMLVMLDGDENVVTLRAVLSASPVTRFVFAARQLPLRSTLARIIREHGGIVLSVDESAVVLAATLISVLASAGTGAGKSGAHD